MSPMLLSCPAVLTFCVCTSRLGSSLVITAVGGGTEVIPFLTGISAPLYHVPNHSPLLLLHTKMHPSSCSNIEQGLTVMCVFVCCSVCSVARLLHLPGKAPSLDRQPVPFCIAQAFCMKVFCDGLLKNSCAPAGSVQFCHPALFAGRLVQHGGMHLHGVVCGVWADVPLA